MIGCVLKTRLKARLNNSQIFQNIKSGELFSILKTKFLMSDIFLKSVFVSIFKISVIKCFPNYLKNVFGRDLPGGDSWCSRAVDGTERNLVHDHFVPEVEASHHQLFRRPPCNHMQMC